MRGRLCLLKMMASKSRLYSSSSSLRSTQYSLTSLNRDIASSARFGLLLSRICLMRSINAVIQRLRDLRSKLVLHRSLEASMSVVFLIFNQALDLCFTSMRSAVIGAEEERRVFAR